MEWIKLPGLVEYETGIKIMEERLNLIIENKKSESVYLLEHQNVYTAGTSYEKNELLFNDEHIPVIYTGRGGKFTYHGPGQRVIYPLLNLASNKREKDIKLYVKNLENWIINTLGKIDIKAYTIKDMVGIWTDVNNKPSKIGAIGVRVKKWITYHGIAVNISTDIAKYAGIIPCGISNFPVTSLNKLGTSITLDNFDLLLKEEFKKIF